LYLIVSGEASVRVPGVGEVARSTTNDLIGEMSIISRQPRSADCVAMLDMTVLQIDYEDFWRLLAGKPNIALGIIRVLSGRLSVTMQNIQERRKDLIAP
jgi:CRP-like cAMP-binding protein